MKKEAIMLCILSLTVILLAGCSKEKENSSASTGTEAEKGGNEMIYLNTTPLLSNIPDPFVLKASDGKFYAYGTTDPQIGYRVYISEDMVNWKSGGLVYKNSRQWQSGDFWAPEVYEYNEKYYLFYTAREQNTGSLKLGVAVADSPSGEFMDLLDTPAFDYGFAMIDAHVFFDEDGRKYLYYSKDCSENIVDTYNTSQIFGVELEDNLITAIGEPVLITTPDNDRETATGQYRWNEGPYVIKHKDTYYLMYSSGYYAEASYHISYASSQNPLGPFIKASENPILESDVENNFSGPGHNSVFFHEDKMYIAYHTHMYKNGGGSRQMCINELSFNENGQLKVLQPVTGKAD